MEASNKSLKKLEITNKKKKKQLKYIKKIKFRKNINYIKKYEEKMNKIIIKYNINCDTINPFTLPGARSPELKYGYINTDSSSPGEAKELIN